MNAGKNIVKQAKYVKEVTNSENRIKTKWKFCIKKILMMVMNIEE